MYTYYSISPTTKLQVFMYSDLLDSKLLHRDIEVTAIYNTKLGKPCNKKLFWDNNEVYIIWNRKRIYLNQFDYDTVDIMSEKIDNYINNNGKYISDDEICATFLKDTDNLGLIVELPIYESAILPLGIKFTGNTTHKVLCVPTEKQYKKNNWYYKFTVECENTKYRDLFPSHHFYFSDFCSLLKSGHVKMVNRDAFKKIMLQKNSERIKREKKITHKIKTFFNKKHPCQEDIVII